MAVNLKAKWNQHAFPDDYPAKEALWAENAERHRVETRREVYLEQTTDLRIRRHTGDKNKHADAKAAKDRMLDDMILLAVGSPEYQAAYNNELSFTIDGAEFEITQGELFERSQAHAAHLRRELEEAKRRGASEAEQMAIAAELDRTEQVGRIVDPRRGELTDAEDHAAVQDLLRQTPALTQHSAPVGNDAALGRDPGNQKTQAADMSASIDHDAAENGVITGWAQAEGRTSFAGTVDDATGDNVAMSLMASFTPAAENTPPADMPDRDQAASADLHRTTGLDL